MNIWIFNHYAIGPDSSGGTRHFDLAKELVKLGHNVTIFASSFNHQKRREEQFYPTKIKVIKKEYEGVFKWGISPNKLYDYMAARLPIILLCNINEPTIINSDSGIIIKENFSKKLSEELVRLSNRRDLVNRLGSNGRCYLEKFQTWSILVRKLDKELK